MLVRLSLVVCAVLALGVFAQPTVAATCGFEGLDFSKLMGQDFTGSDGGTQYTYYLALCGPLTSPATSDCTKIQAEASACQIQVTGGAQTFDIGNYDTTAPPAWSWTDTTKTAVQYTLNGAVQCWANGGAAAAYQANVVLQCAKTQGTMVTITSAAKSCVKTYTLETPYACAGSGGGSDGGGGGHKKKGLSGGWVFIIILCVVVPLYVIGGCVYKHQKLGATGMDKCPNVEFWRDFPSLVKDGFVYTFAKLRGLCGGARGGGGEGSYETM